MVKSGLKEVFREFSLDYGFSRKTSASNEEKIGISRANTEFKHKHLLKNIIKFQAIHLRYLTHPAKGC